MHRPAETPLTLLAIEIVGNIQGVRVEFDHRIDGRDAVLPRAVELLNSIQIPLRDEARRELPGLHAILKPADGDCLELESCHRYWHVPGVLLWAGLGLG